MYLHTYICVNRMPFNYIVKSNRRKGVIIITTLGLVASIWAQCIFLNTIGEEIKYVQYQSPDAFEFIISAIRYNYVAFFVVAAITLTWGMLNSRKYYLIPWCLLKTCEYPVLLYGTTMMLLEPEHSYSGLLLFAILALVLNTYALLCVYTAYKKMTIRIFVRRQEMEALIQEEELINSDQVSGKEPNNSNDYSESFKDYLSTYAEVLERRLEIDSDVVPIHAPVRRNSK